MKNSGILWILVALLFGGSLNAQGTGDAAVQTTQTAKSNHWQNWTFAGIALVIAAGAILVVSMDNGHSAPSSSS